MKEKEKKGKVWKGKKVKERKLKKGNESKRK